MTRNSPFRFHETSPEIIRLAVMMYVCFRLPKRLEGLLLERGIGISWEMVGFWLIR